MGINIKYLLPCDDRVKSLRKIVIFVGIGRGGCGVEEMVDFMLGGSMLTFVAMRRGRMNCEFVC